MKNIFRIYIRLSVIFLIFQSNTYRTYQVLDYINELPKIKRQIVKKRYFWGWDAYYKEDLKGAIKQWSRIKTGHDKLNKSIAHLIERTQDEIKNQKKILNQSDQNFLKSFTEKKRNINVVDYRDLKRLFPLIGLSKKDAGVISRYSKVIAPITSEDKLRQLYGMNQKKIDTIKKYLLIEEGIINVKINVKKKTFIKYVCDHKKEEENIYKKGDTLNLVGFESIKMRVSNAGGIDVLINGEEYYFGKNKHIVNKEIKWNKDTDTYKITIVDWYADRHE